MDNENDLINAPSMFRLAKNVSKHSEHKYKLGAVIVTNGHPLSVGFNKAKSHPSAPRFGLHAEVVAIRNSGRKDLRGSSIFVYRKRGDGKVGMARPCEHCMKELISFGIKWVFYSTTEWPYWNVEKVG